MNGGTGVYHALPDVRACHPAQWERVRAGAAPIQLGAKKCPAVGGAIVIDD